MTPTVAVLQKVLAAYGNQRDPINDSDLDNEQPISLTVYLNLGEVRRARMALIAAGHHPADFDTRPRDHSSQVPETFVNSNHARTCALYWDKLLQGIDSACGCGGLAKDRGAR